MGEEVFVDYKFFTLRMCLCSILWHQAESVRGQRSLDEVKGVDGLFGHCLRHRIQFEHKEPGESCDVCKRMLGTSALWVRDAHRLQIVDFS